MNYTIKEKKTLPKSQFLLSIAIQSDEVMEHVDHVLSHAAKDAELPGFRKGMVPKNMIRERLGEARLFEEAAEDALSHALAEFLEKEKLDVIGRPQVKMQKLAPGNPAEFEIVFSLYPNLELSDYKKIAAKENNKAEEPVKVEEKEIDTVIQEITVQHRAATGKKEFALSDETAKELGEFKDVAELRAKVKEGVEGHKRERLKEKRRGELLDRIVKETKGDIPDILIDSELARMEGELTGEIERMGATFDAYLKEIKKDRETLRKEWRADAEKRARLQLTLFQIAKAEKITAPKEDVQAEMKHLLEHYKNVKEENVRSYVETILLNKEVIKFLEAQK